jgi:hypothetical protein
MANSAARCIEMLPAGRYPKISIHDPGTGRSAVLLNPDRAEVRRIQMDGCLAPEGNASADFVLSLRTVIDVIVELKGKNVDHAVEQIESTRVYWSQHAEYDTGQAISAWIVCKEYPRVNRKVKKYQEKLRSLGGILKVTTKNGEERAFTEFIPQRP